MTSELLAIDKFICEGNNYETIWYQYKTPGFNPLTGEDINGTFVPRFIVEAKWTCNVEHMIDKWHEAQRCTDCYGFFTKFFCEMDTENKEAMVNWILENRKRGYIRN